jgi:hypothetical protein
MSNILVLIDVDQHTSFGLLKMEDVHTASLRKRPISTLIDSRAHGLLRLCISDGMFIHVVNGMENTTY